MRRSAFSTKERVHVKSESGKAKSDEVKPMVAVKSLLSNKYWVIMFVALFLMAKFGKHWMYAAGMGLLTLGFAGFGLFGTGKSIMIFCNVLKGCGLGISGAGFKGEYDIQGIAQPASVEIAICFMYNWVPW